MFVNTYQSCQNVTSFHTLQGIVRAARSLRDAVANGSNIEAREDMAVASVMGGLCLANAKLGAQRLLLLYF